MPLTRRPQQGSGQSGGPPPASPKRPRAPFWTAAEERWLGRGSDAEVAQRLGRTRRGVEGRRLRLGLRKRPNSRWTKAEKRLLAQAMKGPRPRSVTRELAKKLGRSQAAVECYRRARFGRVQRSPRPWTRAEDRLLGTAPDGVVARKLGRQFSAVQHRRSKLGIAPFWPRLVSHQIHPPPPRPPAPPCRQGRLSAAVRLSPGGAARQ